MTPKKIKFNRGKFKENWKDLWKVDNEKGMLLIILTMVFFAVVATPCLAVLFDERVNYTGGWHNLYIGIIIGSIPLAFWIIVGLIYGIKYTFIGSIYLFKTMFGGICTIEEVKTTSPISEMFATIESKQTIDEMKVKIEELKENINDLRSDIEDYPCSSEILTEDNFNPDDFEILTTNDYGDIASSLDLSDEIETALDNSNYISEDDLSDCLSNAEVAFEEDLPDFDDFITHSDLPVDDVALYDQIIDKSLLLPFLKKLAVMTDLSKEFEEDIQSKL